MTQEQIVTLIVLAVILLVILPIYKSKTGRSMSEILVGRGKKRENSGAEKKKSKPTMKNGSTNDLKYFLSEIMVFASRNKMKLVVPGLIKYRGDEANVTAYLVSKSGILGIHCMGFNGEISTSDGGERDWTQTMNGETSSIESPLLKIEHSRSVVKPAFESAGITAPLSFAAVFTTTGVKLTPAVWNCENVYSGRRFMDTLKEKTDNLSAGDTDVEKTAQAIAGLVGIEKMREQAKKKRK